MRERLGDKVIRVLGYGHVGDGKWAMVSGGETVFFKGREMFYLTTHSTHFIYGYMASVIWLRTIMIVRRERDREMFYLTTHSTHFIYGYMASDIWLRTIMIVRRERERNVLFNDALNTFYLWLYGVRHMVKDHYDSEKGEREKCFI